MRRKRYRVEFTELAEAGLKYFSAAKLLEWPDNTVRQFLIFNLRHDPESFGDELVTFAGKEGFFLKVVGPGKYLRCLFEVDGDLVRVWSISEAI